MKLKVRCGTVPEKPEEPELEFWLEEEYGTVYLAASLDGKRIMSAKGGNYPIRIDTPSPSSKTGRVQIRRSAFTAMGLSLEVVEE
jgi:hypothetical protein